MLLVDFSSAFNTIIPQHLVRKLALMGFKTTLWTWILDFLSECGVKQLLSITLSTGSHQHPESATLHTDDT